MRLDFRTMFFAAALSGTMLLSGCGGKEKSGNTVHMKDMEVVDGTATDAMTDLDGVQSESTAIAPTGANAATNGASEANPKEAAPPAQAKDDAEVVSDQ